MCLELNTHKHLFSLKNTLKNKGVRYSITPGNRKLRYIKNPSKENHVLTRNQELGGRKSTKTKVFYKVILSYIS
jgi:hypothetical protein